MYLDYAMQFTPQYGDSFLEHLRLKMLTHGQNVELTLESPTAQKVVNADPNYGALWLQCRERVLHGARERARRLRARQHPDRSLPATMIDPLCSHHVGALEVLQRAQVVTAERLRAFKDLYQRAITGAWAPREEGGVKLGRAPWCSEEEAALWNAEQHLRVESLLVLPAATGSDDDAAARYSAIFGSDVDALQCLP